ncbi:tyrosine-type recombinase/integrase [Formosa algae]|uniref:tyrosine-type recombinase/integrase n=1 Tax=Formosa algae TaxID=225843 RepID=UPI000CCF89FB|nr:site-specific integrase [Formosa algae]PNW27219.1 hypothetical protein BKP44_14090 [Formosa algae]
MIGIFISIVLDTRILKKDNTHAIKIRLTYNRKQSYINLKKYLTKQDWELYKSGNYRRKDLKDLDIFLKVIEAKANDVAQSIDHYSPELFKAKLLDQPSQEDSVFDSLLNREKELRKANRISTANTFQYTYKSILNFTTFKKKRKLTFLNITPEWLQAYENWMLSNGKSVTTIGFYLKNLRTVLNEAIEKGSLTIENYPFSKSKYQIPSARNIKKALFIEDIKKIVEYKPKSESEEYARDMWLFSYLCNGINMKDVAKLKLKNFDKKHIYFIRSKTERSTKSKQKTIVVVRINKINEIISKWANKTNNPDDYVFPILSDKDDPQQEHNKIKQAIKTINKYNKRIAEDLGIESKLTTYSARHSFATITKRSGASSEYIGESLGHSSVRTTENYLDSFLDETRESFQNKLLDF